MDNKKRLNYNLEIDPIFIAQNTLFILHGFDRESAEKVFFYPQKLTSLIVFCSSTKNLDLFERIIKDKPISKKDLEHLSTIMYKSKVMTSNVNRVLNLLKNQDIITSKIIKDKIGIYLNYENSTFINDEIYDALRENVSRMRKVYSRIPTTSFEAFSDRIFGRCYK